MTIQEAMKIVDELSVLKFFPNAPAARAALADKLMQWCKEDLRQARWLVDHGIEGMDEYPGPETLRKLVADKFRPAGPIRPVEASFATVPDCGRCGDLGTIYDQAHGVNVWCTCGQAKRLQSDLPDWITLLNSKRIPAASAQKKRDENTVGILRNLTEGYTGGREH